MMVGIKEIRQEFNAAKKHFNRAIELAKKNVVVGEINFPGKEKKIIKERLKKPAKVTPESEWNEST